MPELRLRFEAALHVATFLCAFVLRLRERHLQHPNTFGGVVLEMVGGELEVAQFSRAEHIRERARVYFVAGEAVWMPRNKTRAFSFADAQQHIAELRTVMRNEGTLFFLDELNIQIAKHLFQFVALRGYGKRLLLLILGGFAEVGEVAGFLLRFHIRERDGLVDPLTMHPEGYP